MKYKNCLKNCKTKKIRSKEPSIHLFLTLYLKVTGEKLKKCDNFCKVYIAFLDVGEIMFGGTWKRIWRKQLNINKIKLFKCTHCGQVFELRTGTEHILEFMYSNKIMERVLQE
ncbi:zinc finger protein [Sulfolobus filamentous virus 1]|uniref:Zinc finger protein n=1 Tax=Sulfolobus filamentous virus 1 TaxID=2304198 RepID=A0A346LU96_SUFV1|nr:zinc finger protein [Sulfolobus filamentous virus 1]AXQ00139.1 zinc finger protein [Sulfolobus filamentous virus 1]